MSLGFLSSKAGRPIHASRSPSAYIHILPRHIRAPARSHPNIEGSSRRWMLNISTERGDRCTANNGSHLFCIAWSSWFQRSLQKAFDIVMRWYQEGVNRGTLRIGIRCKWGKHRSLAFMLLFARCCRRYNHVVYHYALDAPICGCPDVDCRNMQWMTAQQRAAWQVHWDRRADDAEQRAIVLFEGFPMPSM